jgi:N-acetylmuramoyl-L-alanine amidase
MDRAIVQTSTRKSIHKKLLVTAIWSLWGLSFLLGVASSYDKSSFVKAQVSSNVNKVEVKEPNTNISNNTNTNVTSNDNTTKEVSPYANLSGKVIVVDAGHGGADPGTHGSNTGIFECDINLQIANRLSEALKKNGVTVVMTRTDSNTKELGTSKKLTFKERKAIIENANPDMVISVHQNFFKGDSSICGGQVLIRRKEDSTFAEQLQDSVNKVTNSSKNFIQGKYEILKYVDKPGFIIECGFLSNKEEERLLQTQDYQDKIVQVLLENLNTYWSQN